jgi:hypothetical protein
MTTRRAFGRWTVVRPCVSLAVAGLFCLGAIPLVGAEAPGAPGGVAGASAPLAAAPGHSGLASTPSNEGPHPGTLEIWETAGGGPATVDPSVCYYTVCQEPIANVYETLIAYNGSSDGPTPASYVPELATCVPGSQECEAQFGGNDLVYDNLTTGAPQYYTFEIDAGARFYNGATATGWPVYPSDVLFTFARTMGFADLPYEEATSGWVNTQDLVGRGNASWDGGIHSPLNNTPQRILSAFRVNDSAYCPSSSVVITNGCVTFDLGASGAPWPYFLELVADNLGASIEPCGWYTAEGAGVPGFLGTNASQGNGPCLLPGNSTSTGDPGFQSYLSNTAPTAWDSFELQALDLPGIQPSVQWNDTGSGPYYVTNPTSAGYGYTLHANPDYSAPVGCATQPGCLPEAGSYIPNVDVVWASSVAVGLDEMEFGQADSATFFQGSTGTVLGFPDYSILRNVPSLEIFFDPLALNFSVAAYDTQAPPSSLNIPGTFFQNVALRNFLVNAYPYASVDASYNTVDGVSFGEDYGGAIPHDMGDYYPANISWPTGNPTSDPTSVGNVSWWWDEANNASSAWYDPQLSNCTASTPCLWDDFGILGDPTLDGEYALWNSEIDSLSGGALDPGVTDVSGLQLIDNLAGPPGANPMPIYSFGWAPDYPDPTDYVPPLWMPDNSYPGPDALSETLQAAPNNASSCPNDYGAWSNLTYYANLGELPTNCQGGAYDTMVAWINLAATQSNLTFRTLEYNLIEHIGAELALYMYNPQTVVNIAYGDWIEPSTINTNPMLGGQNVQLWFDWGYASNYFNVTFGESGLPANALWSVTLDGQTDSSRQPTISAGPIVNGTYSWSVGGVGDYFATPANGSIEVQGSSVSQNVTFAQPAFAVGFHESGLPNGTAWGVSVTSPAGGAYLSGTSALLWTNLTAGTYSYRAVPVDGYRTPAPGIITFSSGTIVNLTYGTYAVEFAEAGLPSGSSWTVNVNHESWKASQSTQTVDLPNGTYSWSVSGYPYGYMATPAAGTVVVVGSEVTVTVDFGPTEYPVYLTAYGLPANATWSVTLGGERVSTSNDSLEFVEPNGSYVYTVGSPAGFWTASPESVTVVGAPVHVEVMFDPVTYTITFEEKGLPPGTGWSVEAAGNLWGSSGSSFDLTEPNGTYAFAVDPVTGYTSSVTNGSVTLAGQSRLVVITFTPVGTSAANGLFGLSDLDWAVLLGITAAVLVGIGVVFTWRRRRGQADPPES